MGGERGPAPLGFSAPGHPASCLRVCWPAPTAAHSAGTHSTAPAEPPLPFCHTPCVSLMGELPDTPWMRDATERVLGGSSGGSHVAVQMTHAPRCRWSFAPECCSQRPTSGRWGRSGRQRFSRSSRCSQSVLLSCATCSPVLFLLLAPGIG